jgi:hypothetical protein
VLVRRIFGLPVTGGLPGELEVDPDSSETLATGGGAAAEGFTAGVGDADDRADDVAPLVQAASRPTTRSTNVASCRDRDPVTIGASSR